MSMSGTMELIVAAWNGILQDIVAMLRQNPMEWASGDGWTTAGAIHSALMGAAAGLMVLFWALSFFRYVDDVHKVDGREIALWIVKFVLIYALIHASMGILQAILGLAMEANNIIFETANVSAAHVSGADTVFAEVDQLWEGANVLEQIGMFFEMIPLTLLCWIMGLIVIICGIIMTVSVYMRFIKLYIYTAVAPLPLSTLTGRQTADVGKHFLKAYAAVCLEVCVMAIAIALFNALIADNSTILNIFAVTPETGANHAMWDTVMNWLLGTAVKSVLLVACVTGANRMLKEMIGVM